MADKPPKQTAWIGIFLPLAMFGFVAWMGIATLWSAGGIVLVVIGVAVALWLIWRFVTEGGL